MNRIAALIACIVALMAVPATAADIRVIDGDTFELDGEIIRLWGIDAPELDQTCDDEFKGGVFAYEFLQLVLADIADGVRCLPVDVDRYGRTIARCYRGDHDIGETMVRYGAAIDYTRFSNGHYLDAEKKSMGSDSIDCLRINRV